MSGGTGGTGRQESGGAEGDGGRGRVRDWAVVGLVLADLWWTTLCLGGYRPETMPVTAGLIAAAVVVWLALDGWRRRGLELRWVALATLPFLVYAAANVQWVSPVPWLGWRDWRGWVMMTAVFWVVLHGVRGRRPRAVLFGGLALLGVVAVAMATYQRLADPRWLMMGREQAAQFLHRSSGPFGVPNSLAAFMALLLPPTLALGLRRGAGALERVIWGYLAILYACGLLMTVSRGAWLALGAALVAWPALAMRPGGKRWLASLGVLGLILLAVGAAAWRDTEVRHRLDVWWQVPVERSRAVMWRAGWQLFRGAPLVGTGAGSYNTVFERHRPAGFGDDVQWAHNDYLNTLSDYGLVGFLLSFGLGAALVRPWLKRLREEGGAAAAPAPDASRPGALRTGLAIGLLAFALQLLVDFNLKIPALAQAAAALLALAMPQPDGAHRDWFSRTVRLPWTVSAAAVFVVLAAMPLRWLPVCRAESLRYGAAERLGSIERHPQVRSTQIHRLAAIRRSLWSAVRLDPANGDAWNDLAAVLIQQAREEPKAAAQLGREAEHAAGQALSRSKAVPDFWVDHGLACDLQGHWRDAWADFTTALTLAPHRADVWYYYAYHLSLCDLSSARAALMTCLRLDPWNPQALALQKQLSANRH